MKWAKEIRATLERCDYLLLLLSAESVRSDMVAEEVEIAAELAKTTKAAPVCCRYGSGFLSARPCPICLSHYWTRSSSGNGTTIRTPPHYWANCSGYWSSVGNGLKPRCSSPTYLSTRGRRTNHDPRRLADPGGALGTDARFYIQRPADAEVLADVQKNLTLLTLRGAR